MKKFKLKVPRYTFDHKGMIIRGKLRDCEHMVDVHAGDLCDDNMDIMSKENIRQCMIKGDDFTWRYELDELEPYEEVLISHNTKVGIVYVLSIILIISAFMWAIDLCYNVSLFLPLFVTILFTLIVIIATCLALCELEL